MKITLLALATAFLGSVLPVSAQAVAAHYQLNIPMQPLDTALKDFARQTGLQVARMSDRIDGAALVGPVKGDLSVEEALRSLLAPRGLSYKMVNERTFAIVKPGNEDSAAAAARSDAVESTAQNQSQGGDQKTSLWDRFRLAQAAPVSQLSPQSSVASSRSAQTNVPTGADLRPPRDQSPALEEIIVTARKREEKLLDVPAPVSVISADTLQLTQAVRLEDYLTAMPGVSFEEVRAGQTSVIFRGLNTGNGGTTTITYLDNTILTPFSPHSNIGFTTPSLDPSDLAQIEADRGPQGTLYGANAIGGVLKYVTVKPDPNHFSGRAEVSGDLAHGGGLGGAVRGAVNIPLVSDTLGLRVSAFTRKDPGYIDDPSLGLNHLDSVRTYGFRAALLWNLTDTITVNLSSLVQVAHSHGDEEVDIDPYTRQPLYGDLTQERSLRDKFFEGRNAVYNAEIQWDLQWAKLLSSTSVAKLTNGGNRDISLAYSPLLEGALGVPSLGVDNPYQVYSRQTTEELRLTSATHGPVEWQIGAYYVHDLTHNSQGARIFDTTTQDLITSFGPIFDGYYNDNYIERSGFGNLDYHFTRKLDVSVGARYSVDDQRSGSFFEGALFGPAVSLSGPAHEHALTWAVTPRFKPDELHTWYARVATGYRLGGTSLLTPQAEAAGLPGVYKPDRLTNYEVGWKASLPDQHATVDLSVYYIRWRDMQESVVVGDFGAVVNGGSAFSEGVEASFTWMPVRRLSLTASLTYNDNRLQDDGVAPSISQSGKRLPLTPRFSGQLNADYTFPVSNGTTGFAGMTVFATAARPNDFSLGYDPSLPGGQGPLDNFGVIPLYDPNTGVVAGHTNTAIPGYATLDLRTGVVHGAWTLEGYVKNVTDTRAWSSYGGLNNTTVNLSTVWAATVLAPRTAGISLSMKF